MKDWISVDDGFPEGGKNVLMAYKNSYDQFAGILVGRFVNNGFYCSGSSYSLDNVSHWMPLPELPLCKN